MKVKLDLNIVKIITFFIIAFLFIVGTVWFSAWVNKKTGVKESQLCLKYY